MDATALCATAPAGSSAADGEVRVAGTPDELACVRAWAVGAAAWSDLAPDLQRGAELAIALRRELKAALGFPASVGVGRSKIVARMLSPLAKPDGGIRPIAVGDCLARASANCVCKALAASFATYFTSPDDDLPPDAPHPLQLGVGVKGGAETAIDRHTRPWRAGAHPVF